MKKLFFCLLGVFAMTLSVAAQNGRTLGVRAGMNVSNLTAKAEGESLSLDSRISFNVGVAYQQPILKVLPLYLETGLYLQGRGAKSPSDDDIFGNSESTATINMLYVQLPVLVSWHFNFKCVSIQPYAGAYYALGIHGKLKADGVDEKLNLFKNTEIEGESVDQLFKRSDVGLRFGVGVAVKKHYYIGASYDLGLTNIIKDKESASEGKLRNGCFSISLGYNF